MTPNNSYESANQHQEFDPLSDPEERRVLHAALDSFRQYRKAAHYNITHLRRQSFYSLPSKQVDILSEPPFSLPKTFDAVDEAIDSNANLAEAILEVGLSSFGVGPEDGVWKGQATPNDMGKARSTLRQFYRDWSAEGEAERSASYEAISRALLDHLPPVASSKRHVYRILVPGAGLGRLVLDLCAAGYAVEGNEISYHQLLASNFILNFTRTAGQFKLCPFALSFSNHTIRSHQLKSVLVPDIQPAEALEASSAELKSKVHYSERMSMTAGDFCVLYRQAEYTDAFDAVTTCFFIDTAPSLINYIETIINCLKSGGIWINLGPLLWHFESTPTPAEKDKQRQSGSVSSTTTSRAHSSRNDGIGEPGSFELSNDEVIALVERFGFELVEQKEGPTTGYIQDPESMVQNIYRPAFWVAKKK